MPPISAGLLCYRGLAQDLEVLLVHPGGPFFARKDAGSWSIPKGLVQPGEDFFAAAIREFTEEIGWAPPASAAFHDLASIRMKSGKTVYAWAFATDLASLPTLPGTSIFTLEWPPKSARQQTFPEIDRAEFFPLAAAAEKLLPAQLPFLTRLRGLISAGPAGQAA